MKILVIGNGFIGSHLIKALKDHEITILNRNETLKEFDFNLVYYCAGVMRNEDSEEFYKVNYELVKDIVSKIQCPIIYLSTIQYNLDNNYGRSKRLGESAILEYNKGYVVRLYNTFGGGAKPNYNSVISTFMYNIKHDLPITINNPNTKMEICYIDDVVNDLIKTPTKRISNIETTYKITLQELADRIYEFKQNRVNADELGVKLYETYKQY